MKRILALMILSVCTLSAMAQSKSILPGRTPVQYESDIRAFFKNNDWDAGFSLLDEADSAYGTQSVFCELKGEYYYHMQQIDEARSNLLLALRDDSSNTNALRLLIRLERNSGNYSTAIDHINALLEFAPYDKGLWRQKIELYRLLGNDGEADRLLDRIRSIYPKEEIFQIDRREHLQELYLNQRRSGDVDAQIESLEDLVKMYPGEVDYHLALTNLYTRQGRTAEALAASANGVQATKGNIELVRKHVGMLMKQERYYEAESYVDECRHQFNTNGLYVLRQQIRKQWAESLKLNDAYTQNARQYAVNPTTEGLQYLLTTSIRNGYWEDALQYNNDAIKRFGETEHYLSQAIMINTHLGNTGEVARLQEKIYSKNPANGEVADAIAGRKLRAAVDYMTDEQYLEAYPLLQEVLEIAQDEEMIATANRRLAACTAILLEKHETRKIGDAVDTAYAMMKRREFRNASNVLDMVLEKNPDNNEAFLMHADVSQQLHAYDTAFTYLSKYQPLPQEVWDVRRRLSALKARTLRDDISIDHQVMKRSAENIMNHTMTGVYTHEWGRHRLNGYLGYAGRESYDDGMGNQVGGGTGIQLGAGYAYKFNSFTLGGRVLGSNMFFPRVHVALEAEEELKNDWMLTERASWRLIKNEFENYHLFSAGVSASKTIEQLTMTGALDLFKQSISNSIYANTSFKVQYFPWEQERTNVNASIGVGNAPEVALIDQSVADLFSNLNTFVGSGVTAMVTGSLFVNGSVTWYTMGALNGGQVKNYVLTNVSMVFRF